MWENRKEGLDRAVRNTNTTGHVEQEGFTKETKESTDRALGGGPRQLLWEETIHTCATAWVKCTEHRVLAARWSVTLASDLGQSPLVRQ